MNNVIRHNYKYANIGDIIFRKTLLPTNHKGLELTLAILFAAHHTQSSRIHFHTRDNRQYEPLQKVVSSISIADVIHPELEDKKQKKGMRKKLTFKKRKEDTSREEES